MSAGCRLSFGLVVVGGFVGLVVFVFFFGGFGLISRVVLRSVGWSLWQC